MGSSPRRPNRPPPTRKRVATGPRPSPDAMREQNDDVRTRITCAATAGGSALTSAKVVTRHQRASEAAWSHLHATLPATPGDVGRERLSSSAPSPGQNGSAGDDRLCDRRPSRHGRTPGRDLDPNGELIVSTIASRRLICRRPTIRSPAARPALTFNCQRAEVKWCRSDVAVRGVSVTRVVKKFNLFEEAGPARPGHQAALSTTTCWRRSARSAAALPAPLAAALTVSVIRAMTCPVSSIANRDVEVVCLEPVQVIHRQAECCQLLGEHAPSQPALRRNETLCGRDKSASMQMARRKALPVLQPIVTIPRQ